MKTQRIVLHRTHHPASLKLGSSVICRYWFRHADRDWGVSRTDHGNGETLWEVFDSRDVATVRDDYDTLTQLRAEVFEDIQLFLSDQAHEDAET